MNERVMQDGSKKEGGVGEYFSCSSLYCLAVLLYNALSISWKSCRDPRDRLRMVLYKKSIRGERGGIIDEVDENSRSEA